MHRRPFSTHLVPEISNSLYTLQFRNIYLKLRCENNISASWPTKIQCIKCKMVLYSDQKWINETKRAPNRISCRSERQTCYFWMYPYHLTNMNRLWCDLWNPNAGLSILGRVEQHLIDCDMVSEVTKNVLTSLQTLIHKESTLSCF